MPKTWKQPRWLSVSELINCGIPRQKQYYSVIKINELSNHERHGGTLNAQCQVTEASLESYILYDSNCLTIWKRQSYGVSRKISGIQGRKGKKNRWSARTGTIVVKVLDGTVMVDI